MFAAKIFFGFSFVVRKKYFCIFIYNNHSIRTRTKILFEFI